MASKRASYVPRHREVPTASVLTLGVRSSVFYPGVAAIATGVAVSGGVLTPHDADAAAPTMATAVDQAEAGAQRLAEVTPLDRTTSISRGTDDRRADADRLTKTTALSGEAGVARTKVEKINPTDVKALARALMPEFGLSSSEFGCLDGIWTQESGWNVHADNPSSSAYGIPQSLPGSKMASAGPDWANNATTQIKWGLGYIRDRYGSACNAAGFKAGHGWY